jgi:hypothetical protein
VLSITCFNRIAAHYNIRVADKPGYPDCSVVKFGDELKDPPDGCPLYLIGPGIKVFGKPRDQDMYVDLFVLLPVATAEDLEDAILRAMLTEDVCARDIRMYYFHE